MRLTVDSERDVPLSHTDPGDDGLAGIRPSILLGDSLQLQGVAITEHLGRETRGRRERRGGRGGVRGRRDGEEGRERGNQRERGVDRRDKRGGRGASECLFSSSSLGQLLQQNGCGRTYSLSSSYTLFQFNLMVVTMLWL
jgi:hypothetical protein